jgi:hypothetical protein
MNNATFLTSIDDSRIFQPDTILRTSGKFSKNNEEKKLGRSKTVNFEFDISGLTLSDLKADFLANRKIVAVAGLRKKYDLIVNGKVIKIKVGESNKKAYIPTPEEATVAFFASQGLSLKDAYAFIEKAKKEVKEKIAADQKAFEEEEEKESIKEEEEPDFEEEEEEEEEKKE